MKYFSSLIILFSINVAFSQSKVERSKKELNSSSSKEAPALTSASAANNKSTKHSEISYEDTNLFIQITGYVVFGVFKYGVIGDYKNEDHLQNCLSDYPFKNGISGNYEGYETTDNDTIKKNYRLDIENKFLFSKDDVYANHLNVKIRPFQYLYLQADYHQLYQKNFITDSTDKLSLFYFNLGYDRVRLEKFNLGWTIGASYIGNEVKKAGFSVGVNAEYFFGKNLSFLGAAKWSSINKRPVNVLELQGRYHIKKYFVSLGYEHLKIATPTYNFLTFGAGIYLN